MLIPDARAVFSAQGASGVAFDPASEGVVCDGPVAVYQKVGADGHSDVHAPEPVGFPIWALLNVPLASMLAEDGTAWFEFELLRGNRDVGGAPRARLP